ncbi:MAG: hypothetical protein ACYCW6_18595 [Candidatus Xenobia bacterium]
MSLLRLKTPLVLVGLTLLAMLVADLATQAVSAATIVAPHMALQSDAAAAPPAVTRNPETYVRDTADRFGPAIVDVPGQDLGPGNATTGSVSEWDDWISGDILANLELLGTIVGNEDSIAIVLRSPTEQYALHLGQRAGHWTVADINDFSITFSRGREHKTLMLASLTPPHPRGGPPAVAPQQPQVAQAPIIHVRMRGDTRILDRNEVKAAIANPTAIMMTCRLAPVEKNGKPYGVKMAMLAPDNFFHYMGLNQNDIMLSINNQDMNTPEDAMQAWMTLKNESALTIKVDRLGNMLTIPIEIK